LERRKKNIIEEYNAAEKRAEDIYRSEEAVAINRHVASIAGEEKKLLSWGTTITEIQNKYRDLEKKVTRIESYSWLSSSNKDSEYNNNYKNINELEQFLHSDLAIDTVSPDFKKYQTMKDISDHLDNALKTKTPGFDKPAVMALRVDNGKAVLEFQKSIGMNRISNQAWPGSSNNNNYNWNSFKSDYLQYTIAIERYTGTKNNAIRSAQRKRDDAINQAKQKRDRESSSIETVLKNEIAVAEQNRNSNYLHIAAYLLNRFISDEVYAGIIKISQNINLNNRYESKYADYCIINTAFTSIQGFKFPISFAMSDFVNIKDTSGNGYRFSRPQSYSIISAASGIVYVLTSENSINAYDLSKINLFSQNIPPFSVPEKVFYLAKSGINQYMVTKAGNIYRLSLSGNTVAQIKAGTIRGQDTLIVTTVGNNDELYVLGSDGLLNGKTTGSFKLTTGLDGRYITVLLQNRQLIVQE
jgi:hypothetical protein